MKNPDFGKLIRRINWYPPYLGMGIRVKTFRPDFTRFEVELRARWYNRNLFGTHFGGSLYAMCDPFFVFIVMMNLGRNTYHFEAALVDATGQTVARVLKEVYVRSKSIPAKT